MTTTGDKHRKRGELGQGLYSLSDLALLVRYEGHSEDAERVSYWLSEVLNPIEHVPYKTDYGFDDLISLFVVRELLKRGVRPSRIRAAERHLRERWESDRPFVSEAIATDGHDVYLDEVPLTGPPEQIEALSRRGQYTMVEPIRDRLRSVRYHGGRAHQWQPVRDVLIDPRVQFGDPVIEGTRVLTADVAEGAKIFGVKWAADTYAVSAGAVKSAMTFESRLREPSVA